MRTEPNRCNPALSVSGLRAQFFAKLDAFGVVGKHFHRWPCDPRVEVKKAVVELELAELGYKTVFP